MNGSIAGRIIDAAGAPVSGASVTVADSPQPVSDIAALTSADGRFRLGRLPPGPYKIAVHTAGRAAATADVLVAAGQQANVEIRVR